MTDKELNSHDLAREIEIVKLQEENEILKDNAEHNAKVVDKVKWENMLLKKENQETKELLHKIMISGIEEKSTPVLDLYKENQELKLELSGYRQAILNNKEMLGLKEQNEKLKKQLENCYCNRTDCSGRIKDSKIYDSLVQKVETQQKEFINWLEDYINLFDKKDIYEEGSCDMLEEILQKYKEIIGVSDENNIK